MFKASKLLPVSAALTLALSAAVPTALSQSGDKVEFDVNFESLGLAEDAKATEASMTVDGLTLTVTAQGQELNNASKGKAIGVSGNKTGQINADEQLTLAFDRDVMLNRMDFNGLKQKDESQPAESARVGIQALDLEFTVTHNVVAPGNDKIEAKSGDRIVFKGKKFLVPAGQPITIMADDDETRFAFQGITVTTAGDDTADDAEAGDEPN